MSLQPIIIADRYVLGEKIGSGSFGSIYSAFDNKKNIKVAMKLESVAMETQQLIIEKNHYVKLGAGTNCFDNNKGIPKIYDFFQNYKLKQGYYNILVMDLLGDNLENLMQKCGGKFSLKTTIQIAIQLIERIKYLHDNSILHRDIKPDNFLIGPNNIIHIVDLGLSKKYKDHVTSIHIQYRENKRLIGTPRYASINCHLGIEQARRDDIESILYLLIYLLNGKLPWQGIQASNKKTKYKKILEKKLNTSIDLLCRGIPSDFNMLFEYLKTLKFTDKPDYSYILSLFQKMAGKYNIKLDNIYDWDLLNTTNLLDINEKNISKYLPSSLEIDSSSD